MQCIVDGAYKGRVTRPLRCVAMAQCVSVVPARVDVGIGPYGFQRTWCVIGGVHGRVKDAARYGQSKARPK